MSGAITLPYLRVLVAAAVGLADEYEAAEAQLLGLADGRDRHCRFAGCDRPWQWCDVHHLVPRADQGPTNERNLALVCRYHHTLIHQAGWHLGRDPTTGELVTTSP